MVNTPLKSLIILVHQTKINRRVDVYIDCVYQGSIPLKKTFRDIAGNKERSHVEVVSLLPLLTTRLRKIEHDTC